jgi:hypothetical protein
MPIDQLRLCANGMTADGAKALAKVPLSYAQYTPYGAIVPN